MTFQVALTFEDGVTQFVTAQEDQTVAEASYRARINIPVDCMDGACGTCKAFCESGDYDPGFYIDDALTEDEAAEGYCLPCQMKPKSDLVVQIPSTSAVAKTVAGSFDATVTHVNRFSSTVVGFTVTLDDRSALNYLPGQYVNIEVPGADGETRSYSFSSDPASEELHFLVKITPGGLMSTYLAEKAKEGDRLKLHGPNGSFFLRDGDTPLLLLAGGSGLGPILSMLRYSERRGLDRRMHLIYGVNTDEDLAEIDELERLAGVLENFTWDYTVVDEESSSERKGYVTQHMEDKDLHEGAVSVYLCGPPPMVEAVREHFKTIGLEPEGFFYEKFSDTKSAASREHGVEHLLDDLDHESEEEAQAEKAQARSAVRVTAPVSRTTSTGAPRGVPVVGIAEVTDHKLPYDPAQPAYEPLGSGMATLGPDPTAGSVAKLELAGTSDEEAEAATPSASALLVDATGDATARTVSRMDLHSKPEYAPLHDEVTAPILPSADSADDGYEIGEEHPSIHKSDSLFDARTALELGVMELTIGRLTSQQLVGYRLLADQTAPHIEGDQFVDAPAFTETNALFHEYLFTFTGNEHLLDAYQRLGVKGEMHDVLDHATWCHPDIVHEHYEIVEAFEQGDSTLARERIRMHAEHSKETMRRAMRDVSDGLTPAFVSPGRFANKVVVVTGSAQGIGERVARRIGAEGGKLVLADRSELVDEVASQVRSRGAEAETVQADLETWEGNQAVVEAAIKAYGRIDVAIHVVGGTIWAKPFEEYPADQIEKEIRRSLFPTLWSCRAVLPHMYEQGAGTIVNVSSVATKGLNRVPYAAAKGGVNAITKSLAFEAAEHGVRVVATAPGGTTAPPRRISRGGDPETDQEKEWYQTIVDQTVDSSLLKRYGSLDEQAAAICFLASDEASYITGTILPVAGGDLGG